MKYFFVTNVGQIYYRVLPLLANERNATIITFPPMSNYFKLYTKFQVIELKANPNLFTRSILDTIKNINANKKEYNNLLSNIWSSQIYFFGNSWKLGVFLHIEKLSVNNKVFYCPSDQSIPNHHYPRTIKIRLINSIVSFISGLPVRCVSDTGVSSFELLPSFFISNHIERIDEIKDPTHLFDFEFPIMAGKDILFISEDLDDYVTNHEILNSLLELLPDRRTLLKEHPNQETFTKKMLKMTPLPHVIPSELFMSHPWRYIIGVESIALIKATQLSKATVISLLELFDYKDPQRKKDLIDWQTRETHGKILFPKTKEELRELIQ
jgi:hypothetical protein